MGYLEMNHIEKTYPNGFQAIKDISLSIKEKEFLVLLGPSGSGKSTLLRMMAGIEDISAGQISMNGVSIEKMPAKDRNMTMVFQNYALYPHMSVYQNIAFGLDIQKIPKKEIKEAVQQVSHMLEISELLDRKPGTLSGGQKQRVAMSRSMVSNKSIFLMDEPLSNLDATLRHHMRRELKKLHTELEKTFIYVTHDQVEAMAMATQIAIIKDGELMQMDRPEIVYHAPNNLFVATFIGSFAMNIYPGDWKKDRGRSSFILRLTGDKLLTIEGDINLESAYLGIRPEDIKMNGGDNDSDNIHLVGTVAYLEELGINNYMEIKLLSGEIMTVVSEKAVKISEKVHLSLPINKIHLFDIESEKRIYW